MNMSELQAYAKQAAIILLGAVAVIVAPALVLLFWYGVSFLFNYIAPQWFIAWPTSIEILTDNYFGGLLTTISGFIIVAIKEIWDEYKSITIRKKGDHNG